jgi:hypothetical protein
MFLFNVKNQINYKKIFVKIRTHFKNLNDFGVITISFLCKARDSQLTYRFMIEMFILGTAEARTTRSFCKM